MQNTRRDFLKTSSAALAGGLIAPTFFEPQARSANKPRLKSERIGVGAIGMRYQGTVITLKAQAAGVEFTLGAQLTIVLVGLLLSEGSGGIPGGGLVIALIFVQAFNLPLEIAAIVGGIYRLIDMGSTTINVMGDMVGTAIISRSEEAHVTSTAT